MNISNILTTACLYLLFTIYLPSTSHSMDRQLDAFNNPELSCHKKCMIKDKELKKVETIDESTMGKRGKCYQICFDCQRDIEEPGVGTKHPKYKEKWDAYDEKLKQCTTEGLQHITTSQEKTKKDWLDPWKSRTKKFTKWLSNKFS